MLRRRLVLIVFLGVFFSGLAIGGFFLWWYVFPGYRSDSLIEMISNIPASELSLDHDRLRREEHEAFVNSQSTLLKSPRVLSKALTLTSVQETSWFKSIKDNRQLVRLIEELRASPVRGTMLLKVSMECREKEDAMVIVDAVVDQWHQSVKESSTQMFTAEALKSARSEKANLEGQILDNRNALKKIHRDLVPGMLEDPVNNIVHERARTNAEQIEIQEMELAMLEEYQAIYNDPSGVAISAEDRAMVEQDPQIFQTQSQLDLLELTLASEKPKFGENHPMIVQLKAQITAAQETLDNQRFIKNREVRAARIEQVNTAVDAARQALLVLREDQAQAEALLQDQSRLLLEYTLIEKDIEKNEERLLALEDHISGLDRVQRQQSAIRVNIAQRATRPLERSSPSLLYLPAGVFFAMMGAVGIGLTVEFLDKSVRTSQDIVRHLELAMLGAVPDIDDEEVKIKRIETAVADAPRSMMAEAFRRIRTNLQFSAPADRQRTVLVTSPRPEDGKTTVACNLAAALAQSGRRVLLVDANFRRPGLAATFGKPRSAGLSNLLVGEGTLSSFVVKTDLPMMDLLSSGPVPPNPAELIGGERTQAFLAEAMEKYDQIIIDSAPVLLASDALSLSTMVDGVILVVRANQNSRGVARRACRLFAGVNAHVFGAVLNAARVTGGGYYREQLRTYYDYQMDAEQPAGKNKLIAPPGDKSQDSEGQE
jgi:capsular exopolysaccharide synthesis family protein